MIKDRKLTQKELKKLNDLNSIDATKVMVEDLWNKCCKFDSIEADASFVVFSDENPFVNGYNIAIGNLMILTSKNTVRLV